MNNLQKRAIGQLIANALFLGFLVSSVGLVGYAAFCAIVVLLAAVGVGNG
jgi:hypothetical protein